MFPAFYKHCVIFEMGLYPKDWIETGILPYLGYIRFLLMPIEAGALSWFYYLSPKFASMNLELKIGEAVLMFIGLLVLNFLSLDIYRICKLGWMDMQFKFQGIRQVKNMLTTCQPPEDKEGTVAEQEAGDTGEEIWPKIPSPKTMYFKIIQDSDDYSGKEDIKKGDFALNMVQNMEDFKREQNIVYYPHFHEQGNMHDTIEDWIGQNEDDECKGLTEYGKITPRLDAVRKYEKMYEQI